ncbi:protein ABHD11-like isoform X1 [Haliotis rufescens]|uniref:protein ABHD11-like isoform X1 n=2 Tax=Haliotis rufescens TaxID=6454 RepID=UPI00201F9AC8|nr:protein ABHD11-like isoform X1 [Haliotis rufescens]
MNTNLLRVLCNSSVHKCVRHISAKQSYPKAVKLSYTEHDFEQTGSWEVGSLGNKDYAPLMVLHGLFGSKSNWHTIAKKLAEDGHRVITVDGRNHGDSDHSPNMDYYAMRDDVLRLMDDLHLEQTVLVGHSMGGKVAMTLALSQPERLKALVVVDVAPVTSPGGTLLLSYAERMRQIVPDSHVQVSTARKEAEVQLRPIVESSLVRQFLLTNLVEKHGKVQWRLNLDAIIGSYHSVMEFPEFSHPFEKPTKFIGGSLSHHISSETIPEIKSLFPMADITHIPGAGHWVHSENTPEFLSILSDFLTQESLS